MEKLINCPICESSSLSMAFNTQDFFLTKETFAVSKCNACDFLFTNPRPKSSELSRFYQTDDYLSHNTSKKTFLNFIYALLRNISIKKKYLLITKTKLNGKILDIGCGTGEVLNYFKQKEWDTIGIEPAENPRKFAISKYGLSVFSEEKLNVLENESFDVITMWHVLEHVSGLNERIDQIKRLLKKDGIVFIALPNSQSWDAGHYKEYWAAWDVPRHLYHFSKKSLESLTRKNNLILENVYPMKFDSYYVSLLSEKYKHGTTNYLKAFYNGYLSNSYAKKNSGNYSSLIFSIRK